MLYSFVDYIKIEVISSFIYNPFQENLNITIISSKFNNVFSTNQANLNLK